MGVDNSLGRKDRLQEFVDGLDPQVLEQLKRCRFCVVGGADGRSKTMPGLTRSLKEVLGDHVEIPYIGDYRDILSLDPSSFDVCMFDSMSDASSHGYPHPSQMLDVAASYKSANPELVVLLIGYFSGLQLIRIDPYQRSRELGLDGFVNLDERGSESANIAFAALKTKADRLMGIENPYSIVPENWSTLRLTLRDGYMWDTDSVVRLFALLGNPTQDTQISSITFDGSIACITNIGMGRENIHLLEKGLGLLVPHLQDFEFQS